MPLLRPEVDAASIVLLGAFNPAIIRPAWLTRVGLIAEEELTENSVTVVSREVTQLATDILDVQALQQQLTVATARAQPEVVRDFVVGLLTELPHTPVARLGINREAHYRMPDQESWHRLGHMLVPVENWPFLQNPGLRSTIVQGERPDGRKGHVWLRVEPSTSIPLGVFMQQNDHFELGQEATGEDARKLITDAWSDSMKRARSALDSILTLATDKVTGSESHSDKEGRAVVRFSTDSG